MEQWGLHGLPIYLRWSRHLRALLLCIRLSYNPNVVYCACFSGRSPHRHSSPRLPEVSRLFPVGPVYAGIYSCRRWISCEKIGMTSCADRKFNTYNTHRPTRDFVYLLSMIIRWPMPIKQSLYFVLGMLTVFMKQHWTFNLSAKSIIGCRTIVDTLFKSLVPLSNTYLPGLPL